MASVMENVERASPWNIEIDHFYLLLALLVAIGLFTIKINMRSTDCSETNFSIDNFMISSNTDEHNKQLLSTMMAGVFMTKRHWSSKEKFWEHFDQIVLKERQSDMSIIQSEMDLGLQYSEEIEIVEDKPSLPIIKIEDFSIRKQNLGEGKHGRVVFALHKATSFLFALKIIEKKSLSKKHKQYLMNEIKIGTFLNDPNLVKIYGAFNDKENVYLIMEAMQCSLRTQIQKNTLPFCVDHIGGIIYDVCKGLTRLHDAQVIHRDLKPENILVSYFGVVKIADFGLSVKSLSRETYCGTRSYMAPEITGKSAYSFPVDVWSIGCVMCELLHEGSRDGMEEMIKQYASQYLAPSYDAGIQSSIFGTLRLDPEKRFTIHQLMQSRFLTKAIEDSIGPQIVTDIERDFLIMQD